MRNRSSFRFISLPLAILTLIQAFLTVPLSAQTGSPVQPEFQQPSTIGADNLVDLFSGNFNYSVPLFEIGGFPMNLSYSSDHKMEEEASWVGLGWTLNPGAITRQVRGIPDDFNGKGIIHRGSMADNVTTGISPGADVEIFGAYGLSAGTNFTYNTYRGFDISRDLSPSINIAAAMNHDAVKDQATSNSTTDTKKFNANYDVKSKYSTRISTNWNSQAGMSAISFNHQISAWHSLKYNIDFGGFTYTPVSEFPKRITGLTWNAKIGGSFWPVSVHGTLRGHKVTQAYRTNILEQPAYGYLYLQNAQFNDQALLDYNNASGGIFADGSPRLPMSFGTPDVFNATGVGLTGQIKVSRNDVGVFHPPFVQSNSTNGSFGGDISPGNIIHIGANVDVSVVQRTKGPWHLNNRLGRSLRFTGNNYDHESVYMHMAGEATTSLDKNWYNSIGLEDPIAPRLNGNIAGGAGTSNNFTRTAELSGTRRASSNIGLPNRGSEPRRMRSTSITYLNASEATYAGMERSNNIYAPIQDDTNVDFSTFPTPRELSRIDRSKGREIHHLSEIRATTVGGQRFIYGLPSYNRLKQEVSFNIANTASNQTNVSSNFYTDQTNTNFGTVPYVDGVDDSPQNSRGLDNYYDEVETGAYATSFLITSVLSPDYMDRTNDGPTLDDLGQYVKFNYSSFNTDADPKLGWRTPIQEGRATFVPGNLSDPNDDKASFIYGEKEVYYTHHIDSKTHRAVFITSPRKDALSIKNRKGELETSTNQRLRKLDKVKLYTLAELDAKGADAEPLKTVHFTYKEDAAPLEGISGNLPNHADGNSGAKLTLHSVHFTYADNERGAENPYIFKYKTSNTNGKITYQSLLLDRWGNQRIADNTRNPMFFPYALQEKTQVELFADAGNLNDISLPTGGSISIEYEPDDYAYVQNKRAGKMFQITDIISEEGTYSESNNCPSNNADCFRALYEDEGNDEDVPQTKIIVDIEDVDLSAPGVSTTTVINAYFEDVSQLYFDTEIRLGDDDYCNGDCDERVTGYIPFDKDQVTVGNTGDPNVATHLEIVVNSLNRNNNENGNGFQIHPFTFAALEKIRLQIPNLQYDMSNFNGELNVEAMLTLMRQSGGIFTNFFRQKINRGDAKMINLKKSFIRLAEPTKAKYGDGSRVKAVVLNDHWLEGDVANNQTVTTYTKRYHYTTTDDKSGATISSGVAANEPMIGKSENLLVNVDRTPDNRFLAPDETFYTETPFGMQFYPGGQVGYSKVTTTTELDATFVQSKPGYSISEFFTAKDYPVVGRSTRVDKRRSFPLPSILPFSSIYRSRIGLSQGFAVEVNNMHGKMKRSAEHNHYGDLLSSSEYRYKDLPASMAEEPRLQNLVTVSKTDNTLEEEYLGQEVDLWVEMQETASSTGGLGVQGQLDLGFAAGIFPIAAPSAYPNLTSAETSFRTAVATKLISKYGILEEVEVMNNGATLTNNNQNWDALTGVPMLTLTQNEFDQNIYSHTLPAYYVEENQGMTAAYLNEGMRLPLDRIVGGKFTRNSDINMEDLLYPGDEIAIWEIGLFRLTTTARRAFVVPFDDELYLIDETGNLFEPNGNIFSFHLAIVTRSGRRNQLSAPAQQTVSLRPPNNTNYWTENIANTVLSSSATRYSDKWGNQCLPAPTVNVTAENTSCELFSASLQEMVGGFFDVNECRECSVEGYDFDEPTTLQTLRDCELCDDLFEIYANNGWITNLDSYGDCTPGGVRTDAITQGIANCDFINATNPWLTNNNQLYVKSRDGNGVVTETFNSGCTDHVCNTNYSNPATVIYGTATAAADTVSYIYECFPWEPAGQPVATNPFFDGRRGNWRPESNYVAEVSPRLRTGKPDFTENEFDFPALYKDGALESYSPFWEPAGLLNNGSSHQKASQVLAYDDAGNGLENIDAIDVKSATQVGFHRQIPVAVAQNAAQTQIAYESYEDHNYQSDYLTNTPWTRHFSFLDVNGAAQPTQDYSHTGLYSLEIPADVSTTITNTYSTSDCPVEVICESDNPCSCIAEFAPAAGPKYVLSAWIANSRSLATGHSPKNFGAAAGAEVRMRAVFSPSGSSDYFNVTGTVIEGWQRLYGEFDIPSGTTSISIEVTTPGGAGGATTQAYFLDDLRFHPYESNMVTYAYNPLTLRLMAQMDENGYAMFYEYDDEGMLVRQKRETERGIMTVTEQRSNIATN